MAHVRHSEHKAMTTMQSHMKLFCASCVTFPKFHSLKGQELLVLHIWGLFEIIWSSTACKIFPAVQYKTNISPIWLVMVTCRPHRFCRARNTFGLLCFYWNQGAVCLRKKVLGGMMDNSNFQFYLCKSHCLLWS